MIKISQGSKFMNVLVIKEILHSIATASIHMLHFWGKLVITPKSCLHDGPPTALYGPPKGPPKGLSDYSVSVSTPWGLVRLLKALKAILAIQSQRHLRLKMPKLIVSRTQRIYQIIDLTGKTSKPRVYQSICINVHYTSFTYIRILQLSIFHLTTFTTLKHKVVKVVRWKIESCRILM
jgi:hypothetical protein